jgi:hypothetical protein
VLTTLFGIARHVGLHQSDASPVADEDYRFQGARCLSTRQPCAATRSSERIAFWPGHPPYVVAKATAVFGRLS